MILGVSTKLSVQATLNDAFALLRRDAAFTLSVGALFMFVPSFVYFAFAPIAAGGSGEMSSAEAIDLLTMGILVPVAIIGIFTFIGELIVIRIWFQPPGATVGDAMGYGVALVPMAVALHLLISFCSLVGFAMLLIPGMIVVTCTVLVVPLLADRPPLGTIPAWGEGWNLAQGHFWPLLGLVLIVGLMSIAVAAVLGVVDGSYSDDAVAVPPLLSGAVNGIITFVTGMLNSAVAAAAYRQIRTPNVHQIFS
jgi:hypothetical protein